jgi:hypothetical protein
VQSGWTVDLVDDTGKVEQTAVSDATGSYLFPQVPTGTFTLRELPPAGWRQTSPFVSNPSFDNGYAFNADNVGNPPSAIATGDFNHDGFADIAIAYSSDKTVKVWWGSGANTGAPFTGPTSFTGGTSNVAKLLALDFRGTGNTDLVVIDKNGNGWLLQNTGSTTLSSVFTGQSSPWWNFLGSSTSVSGFATGDFNKDGKDDIAFTFSGPMFPGTAIVFGPNKSFAIYYTPFGGDLVAGDVNGDGNLDLVESQAASIGIAYGDGKGGFPNIVSFPSGGVLDDKQQYGQISLGDINGDGRLDILFASNLLGANSVEGFTQDASGNFAVDLSTYFATFTGASGNTVRQIFRDFDGDLRPDIFVAPNSDNNVHPQAGYLQSDTLGASPYLADSIAFPISTAGPPSSVVDVSDMIPMDSNNDGMLDFVTFDQSLKEFTLYRNTAKPNATGITLFVDANVDSFLNQNFDNGQIAPVYGSVYDDANFNGVQDGGETRRSGVRVYLDRNNNYTFDPATEPSTLTDELGTYAFNNLPSGQYEVRVALPPGLMATGGSQRLSVLNGLPLEQRAHNFGVVPALINPLTPVTLKNKQDYSFTVQRTAFGARRPVTFSLLSGAPEFASIDPITGLFTWDPRKPVKKGAYDIFVQVTDLLRPGVVQVERLTITIRNGKRRHEKSHPRRFADSLLNQLHRMNIRRVERGQRPLGMKDLRVPELHGTDDETFKLAASHGFIDYAAIRRDLDGALAGKIPAVAVARVRWGIPSAATH